jgi:HSP20 family protein
MIATCNYINDYDSMFTAADLFDDYFIADPCFEIAELPATGSMIENKMDSSNECVSIPTADIYENDNEFIIKAEMPGVAADGIEVTLNNSKLEIKGKVSSNIPESSELKYSEFDLFDYQRNFSVGNNIDESGLSAKLENGILTVKLPKKEEAKPKKIVVN